MKRAFVLGGRTAIALHVCRALWRAGVTVVAGDAMASSITRVSRAAASFVQLPRPAHDLGTYVDAVSAAALRHRVDVIVPTGEERLWLALAHAQGRTLPAPVALTTRGYDDVDVLSRLHDKAHFQALVGAAGLVPVDTAPATADAIGRVLAAHDRAIFKPRGERFGRGVVVVDRRTPPALWPTADDAIVQPFLPGEERCGFVLAVGGEVKSAVTYVPRWRFPRGPSFCFEPARDDADAALRGAMASMVRAHGLSGALGFDAIASATGTVSLIECNPRFTSGVHVLCDDAIVAALAGAAPSAPATAARAAMVAPAMLVCGRFSDLRGLLRLVGDLARCDDVTWSARDPLPALAFPFVLAELALLARRHGVPAQYVTSHGLAWEPSRWPIATPASTTGAAA